MRPSLRRLLHIVGIFVLMMPVMIGSARENGVEVTSGLVLAYCVIGLMFSAAASSITTYRVRAQR